MIVFHPTADASSEHREHASDHVVQLRSTAQSGNLAAISRDAVLITGGLVVPHVIVIPTVPAANFQPTSAGESEEVTR